MGTIADKLTYLNGTKTAIKEAIEAKGVTVTDTDTFRSYATKIGEISGGGAPATKYGASVDTFLGDVDENRTLNKTTWTGALNFSGIKIIGKDALRYAFYGCTGLTSVDLSSLQTVDSQGLSYAFNGCTGLTSVDLSSLQTVDSQGLSYAFNGCTGLTSADLSLLQSIDGLSLAGAFQYCAGLTTISFPSLTDVQTNSFGSTSTSGAFRYCTALTEIHFRADMQATIEAMSYYSNKWGASNATIYFDL